MARAISSRQAVIAIAPDAEAEADIHERCADLDTTRLRVHRLPADDIWARDFGPITVLENGARRFLDFRFDGWGGKHPAGNDDALTAALHAAGALGAGHLDNYDWVLEGGAIDSDGTGTLLTTTSCLIHAHRNPGMDTATLERQLRRLLGVRRVLWLKHGMLAGDDTDGHIDTLARFVDREAIVYQGCDDPADTHYADLAAMADELAALRASTDRPYRLHRLPLPAPVFDSDGRRLPAGYANFLLANGLIVMPAYADPADDHAAAVLAGCFPDRELVRIDCRGLIAQNGALHCAAMQIPAIPTEP